jgi:hypothetical protein
VIFLGYLLFFSRPLHGLGLTFVAVPSDKSLGYFQSSANADWGSVLFVQSRSDRGPSVFICGELFGWQVSVAVDR